MQNSMCHNNSCHQNTYPLLNETTQPILNGSSANRFCKYNEPSLKSSQPTSLQQRVISNNTCHQPTNTPPGPINLSQVIQEPNFIFPNKELAGGPSQRSSITPIIPPQALSNEYWSTNDFHVPSNINSNVSTDLSRSGYIINEKNLYGCNVDSLIDDQYNTQEPYESYESYETNNMNMGNFNEPISNINNVDQNIDQNIDNLVTVGPNYPGMVNTPYGYYPDQLSTSNIPNNLPISEIQKSDVFNQYNKDTFTSIIQPGVYTRTEVVEPINSNMGITFTQQFEPTSVSKIDDNVEIIQKDPRLIDVNQTVEIIQQKPNESNVYDPRFTGYGTNYRHYIDNVTGQPRFFYDDVMVHRQNNFVSNNKLDWTNFGIKNNHMNSNYTNNEIRNLAQQAFTDDTINFRTELQSKLLRKKHTDAWQQKIAPIHTNS